MKFIRVNGRIVPIKDKEAKGPTKKQAKKYYEKHGDGANQADHIEAKFENKGFQTSKSAKFLAGVGVAGLGASLFTKGKIGAASFATGMGGLIGSAIVAKRKQKKYDVAKQKEYIKHFGTTSSGEKPFSKKVK